MARLPATGSGASPSLATLATLAAPVQRRALPSALARRYEAKSGVDLGGVQVTYNSTEPARYGAAAFTRGSDIHLAPGQERHLGHEAWHAVQQAQGRVGARGRVAGAPLNDDPKLEGEADRMARGAAGPMPASPSPASPSSGRAEGGDASPASGPKPIQRVRDSNGKAVQVKDLPSGHLHAPEQHGYVLEAGDTDAIEAEKVSRRAKATRMVARWRGYVVRRQVQVKSEAPGIVRTTINRSKGAPYLGGHVQDIQNQMQSGATYNRLNVVGGAEAGAVIGTGYRQPPSSPDILADRAPVRSAFINGGYFVHKAGLETDRGTTLEGLGQPVGATASRRDSTPVPEPWVGDYGDLTVGGQVGLSSGPLLAYQGTARPLPDNDRFKYRVPDPNGGQGLVENPLNKRAGALTHSGDANERSAISITQGGQSGRNAVLHTLTAPQRNLGATMRQWQAITGSGAASAQDGGGASTLNLDGGGSVYLGIRSGNGTRPIARGGGNAEVARPVANIIATQSAAERARKRTK